MSCVTHIVTSPPAQSVQIKVIITNILQLHHYTGADDATTEMLDLF